MSEMLGSVAELDAGVREALRRHVLTLADSKRLLGIRYSDWLLGSPSIEAGITFSAMAQDEWGHARLLYAMLKDFDVDPVEIEHERPAEAYASVDPLDRGFEDWAGVVAGVVVVDGALAAALTAFAGGRYESATGRIPKMLSEEVFHRDFGAAWFRRLAEGSDDARRRLAEQAEAMLGRTLAWLAPDDDDPVLLADAGLTDAPETVRERWLEAVAPLLETVGIDAAAAEPMRNGWDAERRRGPGHPEEDAVERARGDRNRALFVE